MRLLGHDISVGRDENAALSISVAKAAPSQAQAIDTRGGWQRILEPFTGAWQRNVEIETTSVSVYPAVYACTSLICGDISKLNVRLKEHIGNDVWRPFDSPAFSPVLRKPNRNQTRIQFFSNWVSSKLMTGNSYILLQRDNRRIVTGMWVLDPSRVRPLVTPSGDVYYELMSDNFSGQNIETYTVPASEIIHDRAVTLWHPLVGVSPIAACGLAAMQGIKIQEQSSRFFANGARPGGIITAPGKITEDNAKRIKEYWETGFSNEKAGRVAVLGDGLNYSSVIMSANDSQLIEQLRWTAETVCTCFLVPPFMIGVGALPNASNVEALTLQYYSRCLQSLIENIESLLDQALGLTSTLAGGKLLGVEFDLRGLLRMDTPTKVKAIGDSIKAGFMKINEARAEFDMEPVIGGDTPYLQQQNFSLEALHLRDQENPLGKPPPAPEPPPIEGDGEDEEEKPEGDEEEEDGPEGDEEEDEASKALSVMNLFTDELLTIKGHKEPAL